MLQEFVLLASSRTLLPSSILAFSWSDKQLNDLALVGTKGARGDIAGGEKNRRETRPRNLSTNEFVPIEISSVKTKDIDLRTSPLVRYKRFLRMMNIMSAPIRTMTAVAPMAMMTFKVLD